MSPVPEIFGIFMSPVPEIFDTNINVEKEKKYDIIEKIILYFLVCFFIKHVPKRIIPVGRKEE